MTKLVLSTGNVMSAGPAFIRKRGSGSRSNHELLHSLRDNFAAAQIDYAPPATNGNGDGNGTATPVTAWTEQTGDSLFIPRVDWRGAGLRDEAGQYEITVKLFLLPGTDASQRETLIGEALDLVRRELGISTIDLLVVSFPGMSFEGDCEWEADERNAQQGNLDDEVATWRILEGLHARGLVRRLGVSEFGSQKLTDFIARTDVRPAVDQVNLTNCCNVPPPLKKLAEDKGIELNVHSDCTDILPRGTLRELLGPTSAGGAGVLADQADASSPGLHGDVVPRWVVRYLAFVRDRGVIENKGYFAGAELRD
ncbi:glutamate--cysteine ligase regulatory subunit [Geosmithia morbida]|uniref:GCS light chain n=1 Tax=Geosmithia morbida TaxID=1094350 RepID=A0A9P4YYR4_9HYPO|nr:glutamate--cysteine ligase regulatory subunit [Geosmithia morbida]KAF4124252.1 glutamate--cysteine ligase regulatory subunit [Geosmithia morbida]